MNLSLLIVRNDHSDKILIYIPRFYTIRATYAYYDFAISRGAIAGLKATQVAM